MKDARIYLGWRWGTEWDTEDAMSHVQWLIQHDMPIDALRLYGEELVAKLISCVIVGWATDVLQPMGDEGYPVEYWGEAWPVYFRPQPLGVGQLHGPLERKEV